MTVNVHEVRGEICCFFRFYFENIRFSNPDKSRNYILLRRLVPTDSGNPSGIKPPCPPVSDSGSTSVYLQALCLQSPSKHWELLMEERPFWLSCSEPLWLKCPSSSSLELIKDKSAWVTQTVRRTETATRCARGQRQKQAFYIQIPVEDTSIFPAQI